MSANIVLRHAVAVGVHQAEAELSEGVPLLGQWTQNPQFRRVVAFLIGGLGVLKRSRRCDAEQRERENARWQRELWHAASWCARIGDKNAAPIDDRRPEGVNRLVEPNALTWRQIHFGERIALGVGVGFVTPPRACGILSSPSSQANEENQLPRVSIPA